MVNVFFTQISSGLPSTSHLAEFSSGYITVPVISANLPGNFNG
jgi:hypothetical protein